MKTGQGELIIARRSTEKSFDQSEYIPCNLCLLWIKISDVSKHQKYRCIVQKNSTTKIPTKKGTSVLRGKIIRGDNVTASESLLKALEGMRIDDISSVVLEDDLICSLGEAWLLKSERNKLKKAAYAREHMRLAARFLIQCRILDPSCVKLASFLTVEKFGVLIQAANMVAGKADSEEDMVHPSVALKIGQDLEKIVSIMQTTSVMSRDKEKKEDSAEMLWLLENEWPKKVTYIARATAEERRFDVEVCLPCPEDLHKLSDYLQSEIANLEVVDDFTKYYRRAVILAEARLATYNKRRPGELEGMRYFRLFSIIISVLIILSRNKVGILSVTYQTVL